MSKILFLTGASGFVGSAALERVMISTDWRVICPTTMRHYGDQSRLRDLRDKYGDRIHVVPCDLAMPFTPGLFGLDGPGSVDFIWNIASESHVDRSLGEPASFIRNNVELMLNVLQFAIDVKPRVFLHMSTDEVFGPQYDDETPHGEWEPHRPSNPYSASKSAQEAIAYSYWRAYGVPLIITNTMNLIGPRQNPEKFVPKMIRALQRGETLTIHANQNEDGSWESGSRCWIGIEDFADAWLWLTQKYDLVTSSPRHAGHLTYYPDMPRECHRFNIVGQRASNLEIAKTLAEILAVDDPDIQMVNFHTSRPGHDMHYGLDGTKLAEFGWTPPVNLVDRLISTVHWYQDNPRALEVNDA
jgi:dTDP-glucose 4,6-dehydratase